MEQYRNLIEQKNAIRLIGQIVTAEKTGQNATLDELDLAVVWILWFSPTCVVLDYSLQPHVPRVER